ncbi:LmeA family phospholipid-binding protein [Streptomyces flavofungini]|uniref:DUF2993 domain-containing protein n=1 Tax=Streptomyces flavofungini TaxID=68200 RepID=A0ABS0X1D9_9ACTN|nr:DUF2993 domain-containing protein [Streptomyces flavofungini]MBJ3807003.1 DUF2993 domain-containing protein [Streptomyces flavofungini]GHC59137.1 hypothetical protein GCM10010349_27650 [Streptomyces flavofungini]
MRSPHRIAAREPSAPFEETTLRNPYEELGALAPHPLDDFLQEDPEDDAETPWQPPNHRRGSRRRRNRFAGLPLAAKVLVALAVGAAFLVLVDRWALLYAEHEAADKLKDQLDLSAAPEVDIEGFPFLTQVFDQRLDEVKVTVPDVAADRVSLAKVSATATDVTMKGDGPTSLTGAVIGRMRGEVLLSFDDLNRELGASQVTFTGHGRDKVYARGTLPVAGHDLKVRADARIERNGERGVATDIDRMRLDIGDMATYRPGARESEGLHLSRTGARRVADESSQAKALLAVPEIARRLGVPDAAVREALRSDAKLNDVTGSPEFVDDVMRLNLIDVAAGHPALLKRLGLDPALLKGLDDLTRPVLVDRLSLAFQLPKLPGEGAMRLQGVKVEKDGIRVGVEGYGIGFGT